ERLRAQAEGHAGEITATLRDVIRTRCAASGPEHERLLVAASVLGRSFDADVLARVTGADSMAVVEALEALCDRRLVRVAGARFDFAHDITREVLYAGLSPARRRALHTRALDELEQAGADPGELAEHAEEAGDPLSAVRYSVL